MLVHLDFLLPSIFQVIFNNVICTCSSNQINEILNAQLHIGLPAITEELHAPPIATTLTAALFVLLMGIAPVFWASFSDRLHVRRVLLFFSMIVFAVASLGAAFINNIWGLVVLRCIQAVGSSCGQSVGAGVIAVM